jgi:hypothetical protein
MPLISKRHFLWLVGIAVPKLRENQRPHFDFFENKKACQYLTGFAVSRDSCPEASGEPTTIILSLL